jgi:threonine/homoserine/homoserine lactone efflux protein
MDPSAALIAGLVAGLAIAMQVGAISLLLIEAAVVAGPRAGVAAGMGVATVDFAFAAVAAAAGGAAGAVLASHETAIKIVAAAVLAAIALHGLARLVTNGRGHATTDGGGAAATEARGEPSERRVGQPEADKVDTRRHYARFLALTAANPLTIASFAAVAAALSLDGPAAAIAFTAGVGVASAGWHLVLSLAAGHAGRWMTDTIRRGLGIGGRVVVLAIAAHLALGAA